MALDGGCPCEYPLRATHRTRKQTHRNVASVFAGPELDASLLRLSTGEQYPVVEDLPYHGDRAEPRPSERTDMGGERGAAFLGVLGLPTPMLLKAGREGRRSGGVFPPPIPGVRSGCSLRFPTMDLPDLFREAYETGLLGTPGEPVAVQEDPSGPEQPREVSVHLA
jgi:hypothetical protein